MATFRIHLGPEEQYIVVEKVLEDAKDDENTNIRRIAWGTLLNFNLTSQEFGNMPIIKAALFQNIEFQASEESLIRLKQTNITSLTPFVKKLAFQPTFYSETLDLSEFAAIVPNIADHKQGLPDSNYDELENIRH